MRGGGRKERRGVTETLEEGEWVTYLSQPYSHNSPLIGGIDREREGEIFHICTTYKLHALLTSPLELKCKTLLYNKQARRD